MSPAPSSTIPACDMVPTVYHPKPDIPPRRYSHPRPAAPRTAMARRDGSARRRLWGRHTGHDGRDDRQTTATSRPPGEQPRGTGEGTDMTTDGVGLNETGDGSGGMPDGADAVDLQST